MNRMKTFYQEIKDIKYTDQEGERLEIFNDSLSGGLIVRYQVDQRVHQQKTVYVNGVECLVEERKFGGFSVYPASGRVNFYYNYKFLILLSVLGFMSFGVMAVIFLFVAYKKYPKFLDLQGLEMRNGMRMEWSSLSSVEQASMTLWAYKASKGAMELYFRESMDRKKPWYLIIPDDFLLKKQLVLSFLDHVFYKNGVKVREKKRGLLSR